MVELKATSAENIITVRDREIAKLRAALEESENKYYDMGFNDVKTSAEPIMFENRKYGFEEGWMAAKTAMRLPKGSPFQNPEQIPYPEPPMPTTQNPTTTKAEDKDTPSMRELVEAIDSQAELIDLEITSNPSIVLTSSQPHLKEPNAQPPMNLNPIQPK